MILRPSRGNRGRTKIVAPLLRFGVRALAAFFLLTPPAAAMSIFDMIQLSKNGYSDKAIIDLIEATDSAFALEAADLSKLKDLGVSEAVIRAMLERAVMNTPITDSDEDEDDSDDPTSKAPDGPSHKESATPTIADPGDRFSTQSVREEKGGGLVHLALDLEGLRFLVLRDEAGHASIESRGRAIARRLGEAWTEERGNFRARRLDTNAEIVFVADSLGGEPKTIPIMTVSAGDAKGYELRSERGVSRDLLARYWADLFSDFCSVDHGDRAERLVTIHEGEALTLLGESLVRLDRSERTLRSALNNVPSSARQHLQRLAETVPREYGETGGH